MTFIIFTDPTHTQGGGTLYRICILAAGILNVILAFYSEKAMASHSSTLAWKIPWTEEPGRLQSMGSLRVGHDWATSLWLFTFTHWRRKWQPTPVFLPGESQGRGACWAAIYGVAQSQTRLKWFSSSSSSSVHHVKCWVGWSTSWNQDSWGNISNLRYADDTTLMAESEKELKSLLMKVKKKSEKGGLKLNIQ